MHGSMARAALAYRTTEVQSQSPLELVALLYAGALRFLHAAVSALERGDLAAKRDAMSKAFAVIAHLQSTLDLEAGGDLARSLDQLYDYVISRLVEANGRKDAAPVHEAIRIISGLHEAWAAIAAPGGGAGTARP